MDERLSQNSFESNEDTSHYQLVNIPATDSSESDASQSPFGDLLNENEVFISATTSESENETTPEHTFVPDDETLIAEIESSESESSPKRFTGSVPYEEIFIPASPSGSDEENELAPTDSNSLQEMNQNINRIEILVPTTSSDSENGSTPDHTFVGDDGTLIPETESSESESSPRNNIESVFDEEIFIPASPSGSDEENEPEPTDLNIQQNINPQTNGIEVFAPATSSESEDERTPNHSLVSEDETLIAETESSESGSEASPRRFIESAPDEEVFILATPPGSDEENEPAATDSNDLQETNQQFVEQREEIIQEINLSNANEAPEMSNFDGRSSLSDHDSFVVIETKSGARNNNQLSDEMEDNVDISISRTSSRVENITNSLENASPQISNGAPQMIPLSQPQPINSDLPSDLVVENTENTSNHSENAPLQAFDDSLAHHSLPTTPLHRLPPNSPDLPPDLIDQNSENRLNHLENLNTPEVDTETTNNSGLIEDFVSGIIPSPFEENFNFLMPALLRNDVNSDGMVEIPQSDEENSDGDETILREETLPIEISPQSRAIIRKIEQFMLGVMNDLRNGRLIEIVVQYRTDWSNCTLENERFTLLPISDARCRHVKSTFNLSLIFYLLQEIHEMLSTNKTCTVRELYYKDVNVTQSQLNVNDALKTICCILDATPWELGIFSTSKGLIAGPLQIHLPDEVVIDCGLDKNGITLPHMMARIVDLKTSATYILVVEKDTVFKKLLQNNIIERWNNECIIVTGKGYPDTNTRLILNKLRELFSLPIYVFTDADPYGIEIMLTYRHGSLSMSNLTESLAVPSVRWLGMFSSDIRKFGIAAVPLTVEDQRKLDNILNRELLVMKQTNLKAEIEGISDSNCAYLIDVYLRNKIDNNDGI